MNEILFQNASPKIKALTNILSTAIKGSIFENKVYYVGGCIRDMLLGLDVKDVDIAVDMPNGGILFAAYICGLNKCVVDNKNPIVYSLYGTAKFQITSNDIVKNIVIECSQPRKEKYTHGSNKPSISFASVEDDAKRRDLTINALYYNLSTEKLHDYHHGIEDLSNMTIRTPSDPYATFYEDPLRILRAIRFSTMLGWDIEKDTWFAMIENAKRIDIVSQEQVTQELNKILLCDNPSIGIRRMYFCGILDKILPDIYDLISVKEQTNPSISTFDHTMKVLDGVQPLIVNRLAALFHDVGKIVLSRIKASDIDNFSADVAQSILMMMKYPKDIVESVHTVIKFHRGFGRFKDGELPPDKKIRKFINLTNNEFAPTMDLMNNNNLYATFGKKPHQVLDILNRIEELGEIERKANIKLPINGNDIQKTLKIKKGKIIGILLKELKEYYFENPKITKEEALRFVKNQFALIL